MRRLQLLFALVLLFFASSARAGSGLDVDKWLRRPGVKLVVVEFYATWCKPCMEAVPKWKALHDRYRKDGLRLIVVSTRDPSGRCSSPGWTPDEVVCDDDGQVADRFGANPLPAAYLWSWQGHLLANRTHVEDVEDAVEDWMRGAPRVDVQASELPPSAGITQAGLRDAVRADLQRSDKLVVLASEEERTALREIVRRSLELNADAATACEVGKEISANSLLRAVITEGTHPRLHLELLSAERGCLVAAGNTRWNPDKASVSISEAVADLIGKLRLRDTQFPWGADAPSAGSQARVSIESLRSAPERSAPGVSADSSFLFVASEPQGATVYVDGREVGRTPHQDVYALGEHVVELRYGELYDPVRQTVTLSESGARMQVELPPRFGILDVRSEPPGAEVFVDGEPTGQRTPCVFPPRKQGRYALELRLPLYRSARRTIELSKGDTTLVEVELEADHGGLEVGSEPAGLEVVLDGKPTGQKTPARFEKLSTGVHEVEVAGGGRRFGLERVRIAAGSFARTRIEVEGYESLLRLTAVAGGQPVQAEAFLDGESLGTTPLQVRVTPGRRPLELRAGSKSRRQDVELLPFETVELEVDLDARDTPKPRPEARRSAAPTSTGNSSSSSSERLRSPNDHEFEITVEGVRVFDENFDGAGLLVRGNFGFRVDDLWLFARLGLETENGQDATELMAGARLYFVDERFSFFGGIQGGRMALPTEPLAVGLHVGSRFILFGGYFGGLQVEGHLLPFEDEPDAKTLFFSGSAQVGAYF